MQDLFFSGPAVWFTVPALFGTGFFVIRLVLLLAGASGFDLGDHDAGHGVPGDHHSDAGDAFKILSLQAVTAFTMGFGWAGLGALRGTAWSMPSVVAVAIAGGIGMVWLLAVILRGMSDLQASGNVSIRSAIGGSGVVYANVPGESRGQGQVTVVIDQRQRTFNAVTPGPDLPSQSRVNVVGVNSDNSLIVVGAVSA